MRPMITSIDRLRISRIVSSLSFGTSKRNPGLNTLLRRIEQSAVVEPNEVEYDRVTMNSRVLFLNENIDEERVLRLVYPSEIANSYDPEKVSVVSPLGAALLGVQRGDVITWNAPAGESRGKVLSILYQPEAAGDPD